MQGPVPVKPALIAADETDHVQDQARRDLPRPDDMARNPALGIDIVWDHAGMDDVVARLDHYLPAGISLPGPRALHISPWTTHTNMARGRRDRV